MEDVFHLGIKGLIRNNAGDVLLLQVNPTKLEGKAYWDLPGGRVQQGSTVEETLRREITEEIGVEEIKNIKPLNMILSNIRIPMSDSSVGLILGIYECTISPDAQIIISDEHIAYKWFTPAKAAELLKFKYPANFCEAIAKL
jgi:dATP pyrophosphohydrolase